MAVTALRPCILTEDEPASIRKQNGWGIEEKRQASHMRHGKAVFLERLGNQTIICANNELAFSDNLAHPSVLSEGSFPCSCRSEKQSQEHRPATNATHVRADSSENATFPARSRCTRTWWIHIGAQNDMASTSVGVLMQRRGHAGCRGTTALGLRWCCSEKTMNSMATSAPESLQAASPCTIPRNR